MQILEDLKTKCVNMEAEAKQEAEQLIAKVKGAVLTRIVIAAAAGLIVGVLVGHFAW
jgi:F0F1-type ATP synthase assembly protein I